ncbi:hypothetical protein GCM10025734_83070 [Kitasatospora paranensis]
MDIPDLAVALTANADTILRRLTQQLARLRLTCRNSTARACPWSPLRGAGPVLERSQSGNTSTPPPQRWHRVPR